MRKIILKYFLLLFIIFLVIFNWNKISWLFNLSVITQFISEYTEGFKKNDFKNIQEKIKLITPPVSQQEALCDFVQKEDSIEIPKLNIFAPLIIVKNNDDIHKALNLGVVHFPNSALPNQKGTIIILGHSAPLNWPKIKYDWVFSKIDMLENGDIIIINFQNCQYKFQVSDKKILKRGSDLPKNWENIDNSALILLSCWPPGKDYQRIAVFSKIIN